VSTDGENMKLISIKGRNVGLLRGDFEFEFDDSLTVITGPIGSGKSTLLTMIRASLTNSFPNSASSWASWNLEAGEISYFVASWRIGAKVLHIAKCLAGDRKFQSLGIPRLRIEHDSGQVEDVDGSREALERTQALVPIPASVIDGHLVVDQDSITAPVASTPAKFKETLHILTKASEMETIRSGIRDLMLSVTVPDVEQPLAEAVSELNTLLGEQAVRQGEHDSSMRRLQELDPDSIKRQLEACLKAAANETERRNLQAQMDDERARVQQLKLRIGSEQSQLDDLVGQEAAIREEALAAKNALYSADLLLQANERRRRLLVESEAAQAQLKDLMSREPQAPTEPAPDPLDEQRCVDHLADARTLKSEISRRLDLAEAGCCTQCGQATGLPEEEILGLKANLEEIEMLRSAKELELSGIRSLVSRWRKHEQALVEYEAKAAKAMEQAARTQAELEEIGDIAPMTAQMKSQFALTASTHDGLVRNISAKESGLGALQAHVSRGEEAIANLDVRLQSMPVERYDDNEHARLTKARQDADACANEVIHLRGVLQQLQSSVDRAKTKVEAQERRKASVEPIRRFRSVLSKAGDALVKDNLPRILSLQYIKALNERLDFYLQTVRADFTAYIDDNLEFMARKNDGLIHAARRLSGGQKQQASVCYLLAVNDVFASTLGVLALDEPSGAMQESNSRDLAEAFNYLARLGQASGRQFIVITHSPALAAHGCRHIELEGA